jgi:hypothetical protein
MGRDSAGHRGSWDLRYTPRVVALGRPSRAAAAPAALLPPLADLVAHTFTTGPVGIGRRRPEATATTRKGDYRV